MLTRRRLMTVALVAAGGAMLAAEHAAAQEKITLAIGHSSTAAKASRPVPVPTSMIASKRLPATASASSIARQPLVVP